MSKKFTGKKMNEEKIICCLRCKKLRWEEGDWVTVESETVQIITSDLAYGYCDICADKLYTELELGNFFE